MFCPHPTRSRSPRRRAVAWLSVAVAWLSVALAGASCASRRPAADEVPLDALHALPKVRVAPRAPPSDDGGSDAEVPEPPAVRAVSWGVFGEGERIAELQGVPVGPLTLLAWVTYVDPAATVPAERGAKGAASARVAPRTASVLVRAVDRAGEPVGAAKVISSKAVGPGGVALTTSPVRAGATLAWTGLDNGKAQVFLTHVDRAGDKAAQRMLTRGGDDCSDVSITAAGDGFLVAWVEQHGAAAAVFAARVGKDLVRIGEARKIADAGGDASQVRLSARGDDALMVWSEVRAGSEKSGIFGVRLATASLAPRGDVMRLIAAPHPQSLRVAGWRDSWVLGWLDGPVTGAGGARQAAIAVLTASRPRDPARFDVPADLTSLALECDDACRIVAAGIASTGGAVEVYAWRYDTATAQWPAPRAVGAVSGTSGEDMSPVLLGDWLFFAEDDLNGKGRIAKTRLIWP